MSIGSLEHRRIRVLVADDHPVVLRGMSGLVEDEPDMQVVGQAAHGQEAVLLWQTHRPDITLLDLRMPQMDGVAAMKAILCQDGRARVIVMTTFDGEEDIYNALRAGAKAYLLKKASREEVIESIRAVHAGQKRIPPEVALKLADRMSQDALTEREGEILRLLTTGKSNAEIAGALYIAETTVRFHLTNLFAKLGVEDRTQAVTTGLRRGLVRLE